MQALNSSQPIPVRQAPAATPAGEAPRRAGPVLPIDTTDGFAMPYEQARRIGEALSGDYCFA
ncbi:MAG TPA: hypothetical protein VFZ93_04795, partial [Albitalea sp.]